MYIGVRDMVKIIEAVYENDVLKPMEKLELKDGQRVKIMIVERDFIDIAQEIRTRFREEFRGKDLVKEFVRERERFG